MRKSIKIIQPGKKAETWKPAPGGTYSNGSVKSYDPVKRAERK